MVLEQVNDFCLTGALPFSACMILWLKNVDFKGKN